MQDRACHGYIGQAGAREIFTNMCIVRVFWILKTDSFWIALAVSSWPGILPDSRRSINSKRRSTRTWNLRKVRHSNLENRKNRDKFIHQRKDYNPGDESITIIKHFGVDIFCVRVTLPSHIIEGEEETWLPSEMSERGMMLRRLFLLTHSLPQCVYCALYSCTVITCTGCNGHLSEGVRGNCCLNKHWGSWEQIAWWSLLLWWWGQLLMLVLHKRNLVTSDIPSYASVAPSERWRLMSVGPGQLPRDHLSSDSGVRVRASCD